MCNHFIARTGKFLPVCRLHLGDRCAAWKVKFFRVGIENVGLNRRAASRGSSAASRRTSCSRSSRLILAAAISSRSLSGCASRTSRTVRPAFSCRIIDRNTRLDIIDVHAEQHSLALILDGFRLHQDAGGNQIIALKEPVSRGT